MKGSNVICLLAGVAIGGAAAMLLASPSGKELQGKIKKFINDNVDKLSCACGCGCDMGLDCDCDEGCDCNCDIPETQNCEK